MAQLPDTSMTGDAGSEPESLTLPSLDTWEVGGGIDSISLTRTSGRVEITASDQASKHLLYTQVDVRRHGGRRLVVAAHVATNFSSTKIWLRLEGDRGKIGFVTQGILDNAREAQAFVDLPDGVTTAWIGIQFIGAGSASVDDVHALLESPDRQVLRGMVTTSDGMPVLGGAVTAWTPGIDKPLDSVAIKDNQFTMSLPPGEYRLSAASRTHSATHMDAVNASTGNVQIQMDSIGVDIGGHIESAGVQLPGVRAISIETSAGLRFHIATAPDGTFAAKVPPGEYDVRVEDDDLLQEGLMVTAPAHVALPAHSWSDLRPSPSPRVIETLKSIPDFTSEATLSSFASSLASRDVVSFGEPTHGTAQSFELRALLFKEVALKHGFRGLALETNWAETLAIDDYVTGADIDIESALVRTRFWTIQLEEVKSLLDWMRAENATRRGPDLLRVVGLDMQYADGAIDLLDEILRRASVCTEETASLAPLRSSDAVTTYAQAPASVHASVDSALENLRKCVTKRARRLQQSATGRAWLPARLVDMIEQSNRLLKLPVRERFHLRDRLMAENAVWAHGWLGSGLLVALHDVHNGYGTWGGGYVSTGTHLRQILGQRHYAIGLLVANGEFLAYDARHGASTSPGVVPIAALSPEPGTLLDVLSSLGSRTIALKTSDARLEGWLESWHVMNVVGSILWHAADMNIVRQPSKMFDAIVFASPGRPATPIKSAVLTEF